MPDSTGFLHDDGSSADDDLLDIFDITATPEETLHGDDIDPVMAEIVEEKGVELDGTLAPPPPKKGEKGFDPRVFRWQRERAKVCAKARLVRFIEGISARMSIKEAALFAGVHPHHARQHYWPKLKAMALEEWTEPEERERIAHMIVAGFKEVYGKSMDMLNAGEGAAYGAVAISALKELRDTLGINMTGESGDVGKTDSLESLAESIRESMPALIGHHEHIARIKARQLAGEAVTRGQKAGRTVEVAGEAETVSD